MNKKINNIIKVLLVLAVILVVVNVFRAEYSPYVKQVAKVGTYINSIDTEAIIVRNETIVGAGEKGALQAAVKEGEKVSAYSRLGAFVSGGADEEKIEELNRLNEEIEDITHTINEAGVLTIGDDKIEGRLKAAMESFVYSVARDDVETAISLTEDIKILSERKAGVSTQITPEEQLAQLTKQRDALSKELGGTHKEVYAPCAGVFSSNVDSLEEKLTLKNIKNQNAATVEALFEDVKKSSMKTGCKVVNNYKWCILMSLTKDEWEGLTLGKEYPVAFNELGESEIKGKVSYISQPDKDGKCAVSMEFDRYLEEFTTIRSTRVQICKEKITGIYVPIRALRVDEKKGVEGVWVQNEAVLEFRSVQEVFRSDEFILVKENAEGKMGYSNIELYDSMVLNPDK